MLKIIRFANVTGIFVLLGAGSFYAARAGDAPRHSYRLPSADSKERVIWGSTAEAPDGVAISFGGQDQESADGQSHTRLRTGGQWTDIYEELCKTNHLQPYYDEAWELVDAQRHALARARFVYLEGLPAEELKRATSGEVLLREKRLSNDVHLLVLMIEKAAVKDKGLGDLIGRMNAIQGMVDANAQEVQNGITPGTLARMRQTLLAIQQAQDTASAQPPARALSAIAYEPRTKLFVVFGGDHCDYLTNDTWVFDPAIRKWSQRTPPFAPPPRANHAWKIRGDGKLTLTGGYTYSSDAGSVGGQYVDTGDGEWTYDVAANAWSGTGKGEAANSRTYRTGPFLPEHFLGEPKPDAAEFQARLRALPANVWTKTNPVWLPQTNDGGCSAVIDPDHDLILCPSGGAEVLEFHLASNRWELCHPVELAPGRTNCKSEVPNGFNFNRRPWIGADADRRYGFDAALNKMLFLGRASFGYVYDPQRGDWTSRGPLPKEINSGGALITTSTPQGLVCWTQAGLLFRFDALSSRWNELHTTGEPLPGAEVEHSTAIYDSRRDRLLFFGKPKGDGALYDGTLFSLDMKSLQVARLSPAGKDALGAELNIARLCYDPAHDLLLGGTMPTHGADDARRTLGYDCAGNKWVSCHLAGDDPRGEKGMEPPPGLIYDAHRDLLWAVTAQCQVFVLRFDPHSADEQDLGGSIGGARRR